MTPGATLALLGALAAGGAGGEAPPDLDLLVCQAVRAQQAIEYRWREHEYRKDDTVEKLDGGRVVERAVTTRRIHRSRPHGIAVNEVVARDGRPLPAEEAARETAKVRARQAALAEPQELGRALARRNRDSEEKIAALESLRRGFLFRLEGLDWVEGEACWVVSFLPNPGFRPRTREEENFKNFRGVAFIRARDPLFLLIECDFVDNVSVKFGPFATLTPGSHLRLVQDELLPGTPLTRSLTLDLRLRIFFLVRRYERRTTAYRDAVRVNDHSPGPRP